MMPSPEHGPSIKILSNCLLSMGASDNVADQMLELYNGLDRGYLRAEYPRSSETTTPTELEQFVKDTFITVYRQTVSEAKAAS